MAENINIKIQNAARELGVSPRTLYYWVELGDLEMVEPGKVNLADATRVYAEKQERRTELSTTLSNRFTRDEQGRFRLLTGKLNGKRIN